MLESELLDWPGCVVLALPDAANTFLPLPALARGLRVLHADFVRDSVQRNTLQDWRAYELASVQYT